MFLFSINAVSRQDQGEFTAGEEVPFIVYIDFKDLFGAEQLATVFVMREGFRDAQLKGQRLLAILDALGQEHPAYAAQLSVLAQGIRA